MGAFFEELIKFSFLALELSSQVQRYRKINFITGMSSGLVYVPSAYADEEELVELCKVVRIFIV